MKALYIVVALVAVGAGAYLLMQNRDAMPGTGTAAEEQRQEFSQSINAELDAAMPADSSSEFDDVDSDIDSL